MLELRINGFGGQGSVPYKYRNKSKHMKTAKTQAVKAASRFLLAIAEATHNSILLRIMNTVADLRHNTFRIQREELFADKYRDIVAGQKAIYNAIRDRSFQAVIESSMNIREIVNKYLVLTFLGNQIININKNHV